jgi:hypothetical protein
VTTLTLSIVTPNEFKSRIATFVIGLHMPERSGCEVHAL